MSDKAGNNAWRLILGTIGVVFGDIGTSPLYTVRQAFSPSVGLPPTPASVFGVLSLIFWALMIVVTLKYVIFILQSSSRLY